MQAPVDPMVFANAIQVLGSSIVPSRRELDERYFVWGVTVYLVAAHKDEDCFRSVKARRLEEIHGANRVDFEVIEWDRRGLVVGWLRRTMHDHVKRVVA